MTEIIKEKMVPDDFGSVNGTPISNLNTILKEINLSLGTAKNSDVEYILVKPFSHLKIFGYGTNYNMYGHSAVAYRLPNMYPCVFCGKEYGECNHTRDIVMNIEGKKDGKFMIQFYSKTEYLYGTDAKQIALQKGAYNRDMVGIRIENVDDVDIAKMHNYFLHIRDNEKSGMKKFNIVFGPLINTINKWLFSEINFPEYGNCAKWTSEGLKRAKIATSVSIWPKSILIDIFENYNKSTINYDLNNMHVVYYERPINAKLSYGKGGAPIEAVAPLQLFRSVVYGDMRAFADCIVKVPENSITAEVIRKQNPLQPDPLRNIVNNNYFIIGSCLTSILLYKRGFNILTYVTKLKKYR